MKLLSVASNSHNRSCKNAGFTLLEMLISMSVSSVLLATILVGYQISLDTFDAQLTDTNLWVELRDATASMSRDLRDANAVDTSSGILLISITLNTDGLIYSYYINSNNELIRQQGTNGIDGRVIVSGMDKNNTSVVQNGNLVSINLVAKQAEQTARIFTSVNPRNI